LRAGSAGTRRAEACRAEACRAGACSAGTSVPATCASILIALTVAAIAVTGLSAHRRDELLQAARIAFDANRLDVDLDLTPGLELAEPVIADADLDRDGRLSADEQWAYCRRVIAAITLELDGEPLDVRPRACTFAALEEVRRGEGTIQLQLTAAAPPRLVGTHQVLFRNRFQPGGSVYVANALVPASDRVAVTAQHRDGDQRSLAIDYRIQSAPSSRLPLWPLGAMAGGALLSMLALRRGLAATPR
jgi:hypothetical protein